MRKTVVVVMLSVIGFLAVVSVGAAPARKSALVRFITPTIVAGSIVHGTVVFEHDDSRMARGEPCTTVYQYDPWRNKRGNVIVEFMCIPQERAIASTFEASCVRGAPGSPNRLLEYQFAGDTEGHAVPID